MSFTNELLKAEQEMVSRETTFQKNKINIYSDRIVEAVKKATMYIAKTSQNHQAQGYISSFEGDCLFENSPSCISINYASELNKGKISIKELEQVCDRAETILGELGFKKASIRIINQDLDKTESHPAIIMDNGYAEPRFWGKKKPQKYLLYVSVTW